MKNQTEKIKEADSLEIIEKFPEKVIQESLELYAKSANLEVYVKIVFGIVAVLFLIHNVFIAGKSYAYDTYETIKNTEFSILGVFMLTVFIIAGMAISNNLKMAKKLKEASKRYAVKLEIAQEEFSALAVHLYGGRGVKLNK